MTDPIKQHGVFSWSELMTTDVSAAKVFYGKLFGWALEDMQTCDMGYTMAKAGDKEVAGIMGMPPDLAGLRFSRSGKITVPYSINSTPRKSLATMIANAPVF